MCISAPLQTTVLNCGVQHTHFVNTSVIPVQRPPPPLIQVPMQTYEYQSASSTPHFPAPLAPFSLVFLFGNIRMCSGCRRSFPKKPDGDFADPPYNLAVKHEEEREFLHPSTREKMSKYGNAYYHVFSSCLEAKWPDFSPSQVHISSEVHQKLLPIHKQLLLTNFGLHL